MKSLGGVAALDNVSQIALLLQHSAALTNSHSSGKGGAGNMTDKTLTEADLAKMSLEERKAHEHMAAHDRHVVTGGRG